MTATVPNERAWFALRVKPRHEKAVAEALRFKRLEQFLPLYRQSRCWSDRTQMVELPLFPGYLFCRFGYPDRLAVLNTPGVTSIVGAGRTSTPVPDEQVAAVQSIVASGLPARPAPYLRPGQLVRLARGPLAGLTGILLREKDAHWVVVNVELLNRSVAVQIERTAVRGDCQPRGPAMPLSFPITGQSA